jgi:uncharacterized membrane protein YfcA
VVLIAAITAAAALYGTIAGLGGGIIIVPALLLTGVALSTATPLSLAAVFVGAIAGLLPVARRRLIDRSALLTLAPAAFIGSALGGVAAQRLPEEPLLLVFAVISVAVARDALLPDHPLVTKRSDHRTGQLLLGGGAGGFFSGALGIGGGVFVVPTARRFGPMRIEAATATSVAVIVGSSAIGVLSNLATATTAGAGITSSELLAAGLGAAAGGYAGGRLSPRVPERARALLIATVAVAAALVALLRLVA